MDNLISVVIINWNNKEYLGRCIDSILCQTYSNYEIVFIDNQSSDGSYEYVKNMYRQINIIKFSSDKNLGYAGGANKGIEMSKGSYVVVMNPDVVLEPNFLEMCYKCALQDDTIGAISGKLLKYDFQQDKKLNIIDSTGIIVEKNRRAADRGQNEEDIGQYQHIERIFGVCGAAAFYKREALDYIKVCDEYFDEDFFAYKEDIDLSWRLNLCGYKNIYYPNAIAYHGRGLGGSRGGVKKFIKNRKGQSEFLRGISFRNHYLMLYKNETKGTYSKHKYFILKRVVMLIGYSLIYERFIFKYIKQIFRLKNRMLDKKEAIMKKRKASDDELLSLFSE